MLWRLFLLLHHFFDGALGNPWLTGSLDDELFSLDEAAFLSVDALVSDDPLPSHVGTIGGLARPAVPTPPPGLGHPSRTASPAPRQAPIPVVPATPLTPAAPKPAVPTMANIVRTSTPDQTPRKKATGTEAKKNIKALAVESGLSKDIASQASPSKGRPLLQEEDFPALDAVKGIATRPGTPSRSAVATPKIAPASIKKPQTEAPTTASAPATEAPKLTPKAAEKKPMPGILNIAAATKAAQPKQSETGTAEQSESSAFPALPTPTTASVASPITRAAPKTLRVVSTPKAEVPPALHSGTASTAARAVSTAHGRPGTPASEIISDSASIVSASISASRTSSPPPSRIGTAPVRTTTKSQQRKQRKEAHKEQSATIAVAPKVAEAEEQAPIIGRKKKQKKEKPVTTPPVVPKKAIERAATPPPPPKEPSPPPKPALETTVVDLPPPKGKAAKNAAKMAKAAEEKGKSKEVPATPTPSPPAPTAVVAPEESQDIGENPKTIPEVVFQDLVGAGEAPPPDALTLLKPLAEQNTRIDRAHAAAAHGNNPPPSTATKNMISEADHAILVTGQPVRKVIDGHRVLITPNGDCVRNLTEEEEDRYLELQKRVAAASEQPDSFVAPRHQARPGGFSLIKGRAVPNGPPSYFPPPPNAQKMFSDDPVNKIQREEAISYINQFVLPRLNLGNTNLFPGSWKSAPGAKDALSARETAAASLNSLAPYIYGHDAAAGAGIYSAESGGSGKDIPEDETPFGGLDSPHHQGSEAAVASASASAAAAAAAQAHAHGSSAHPKLPGTPLNAMSLMSVEDAETALGLARKETEKLEKGLNQAIKRNRRLLLGGR
ncbi:hypothetical protein CSUB01_08315 [Colletotrichum sublineola]|uniref:General negative regulator of transcription subunit 4 n=1 Tax=Colletotrichum sublineola TaxID=1173701 RepID=A0A066XNG0_COLSU|nr:hypothetical protein CSUB01_08315 [Colletotrichum sublineola]